MRPTRPTTTSRATTRALAVQFRYDPEQRLRAVPSSCSQPDRRGSRRAHRRRQLRQDDAVPAMKNAGFDDVAAVTSSGGLTARTSPSGTTSRTVAADVDELCSRWTTSTRSSC